MHFLVWTLYPVTLYQPLKLYALFPHFLCLEHILTLKVLWDRTLMLALSPAVVSAPPASCKGHEYVKPTATSGHLSSLVTETTRCGSAETPWLLTAQPGQKINITLWDFSLGGFVENGTITFPSKQHCHVYAIIKVGFNLSSIIQIRGGSRNSLRGGGGGSGPEFFEGGGV